MDPEIFRATSTLAAAVIAAFTAWIIATYIYKKQKAIEADNQVNSEARSQYGKLLSATNRWYLHIRRRGKPRNLRVIERAVDEQIGIAVTYCTSDVLIALRRYYDALLAYERVIYEVDAAVFCDTAADQDLELIKRKEVKLERMKLFSAIRAALHSNSSLRFAEKEMLGFSPPDIKDSFANYCERADKRIGGSVL